MTLRTPPASRWPSNALLADSLSDRSALRASGGTAMTERCRSWTVTGVVFMEGLLAGAVVREVGSKKYTWLTSYSSIPIFVLQVERQHARRMRRGPHASSSSRLAGSG